MYFLTNFSEYYKEAERNKEKLNAVVYNDISVVIL
jgi:hypothetical protein